MSHSRRNLVSQTCPAQLANDVAAWPMKYNMSIYANLMLVTYEIYKRVVNSSVNNMTAVRIRKHSLVVQWF